jgi:nucleoside-diphosphate-sugar epimerase
VPADIPALVRSNIELGTLVGEGAAQCGAVLVNTGTAWQHFEGRPYDPVSLYAATKQALTDILEYYARVRGVDVREVTLFDTYGPRDTRPKLVPALLSAARYATPLPMSDGGQLIDLTYVDDVAKGIATVALAKDPTGPTVVRSGRTVSIRQLVAELESVVGVSVPVQWDARPRREREMREDWRFGQAPDGWTPSVALAEGLRRTWDQFAAGHA